MGREGGGVYEADCGGGKLIIDKSQKYNTYFMAYLKVHDIKDGEEVRAVDYMAWITSKHHAFREIKKCGYYNGFPPEVQDEFNEFILSGCVRGMVER